MNDLTFYQLTQQRKIRTAGWLMVLSIVLLVLFQGYWLRKTYRDEYQSLRRELGIVLRETSVRRQLQFLSNDSTRSRFVFADSGSKERRAIFVTDTVLGKKNDGQIQVSINIPPPDTGRRTGGVRMVALDAERRNDNRDDLSKLVVQAPFFGTEKDLPALQKSYSKALDENDLTFPFSIRLLSAKEQQRRENDPSPGMRRGPSIPGMKIVAASFDSVFWMVIPKMMWPIFFSLAMLGITITAFLFLYKSLKTQQRLALLKNDFISNMTHELKTPIATVGVAIEALKSFHALNDPKRTQEYLDISAGELQRLNLLVDKVLRVSMFEQDKMELQQTVTDLTALAQQVVSSMRLQLEKAHAHCELHAAPAVMVKADALHLQSVLYNLLDNALKYSGDHPSIDIHITQTDGRVQLRVSDKGEGIPAEYSDKVFDKFFRVPHGDTHNIKGYGLGLSYVAEVIKKHGGSIRVEPVQPHGACFVIELQSA